jgi:hypothetical protein
MKTDKVFRCNKDVVLAGRIKILTGNDVIVLDEVKDSFNIPCLIVQSKKKTFATHKSYFFKYFYFLKNIERVEQ